MSGGAVAIEVVRLPHAADLPLPSYATEGAAGMDLLAAVSGPLVIAPGARALVPTGLRLAVPPGHELQVRPRSGLALRHGVVLPNSPGTIDGDFRGYATPSKTSLDTGGACVNDRIIVEGGRHGVPLQTSG